MNTIRSRRLSAAALAVLLLLASPLPVPAAEGSQRFTMVARGHANPTETSDPCVLINTETAVGVASSIGIVHFRSTEVVNFCSNPDGADVDGEFVLTARNGDEIHGTYRTLAHADFIANELSAAGHYEIRGGTGRFAEVSGKGAIAAAGSLLPPFGFDGGLFGHISF